MLDKFKFWKKEDNFDFNLPTTDTMDNPFSDHNFQPQQQFQPQQDPYNFPNQSMGQPEPFGFNTQPSATSPQPQNSSRDIDLILSRLDTLKASIDHLTTRIEHLEKSSNEKHRW